jgi:hypothetical protein
MRRVLAAALAKLAQLDSPGRSLLVLGGRVIPFFALAALQGDDFSHGDSVPKISNLKI